MRGGHDAGKQGREKGGKGAARGGVTAESEACVRAASPSSPAVKDWVDLLFSLLFKDTQVHQSVVAWPL